MEDRRDMSAHDDDDDDASEQSVGSVASDPDWVCPYSCLCMCAGSRATWPIWRPNCGKLISDALIVVQTSGHESEGSSSDGSYPSEVCPLICVLPAVYREAEVSKRAPNFQITLKRARQWLNWCVSAYIYVCVCSCVFVLLNWLCIRLLEWHCEDPTWSSLRDALMRQRYLSEVQPRAHLKNNEAFCGGC